nr:hypothetical protein [Tanacetum cinerariifolium]
MYFEFKRAFHRLFGANEKTFKFELDNNMKNLETQLNKETLHEKDSKSTLRVIDAQFQMFIHLEVSEPFNYNSYDLETRQDFKDYTNMEAQTFKEIIIQNMDSIEQSMAEVPYTTEYNVFAVETQHSEQPENMNDTYLMEKVDSNTTPDSSDMYLKCYIDENKKIQKQLRNANTTLTHELKECKSTLKKTHRTHGESNRTRDRYLVAIHDKEVDLAKYKTFKDCTIENDTLERKLKETQAILAQKEHNIKEGLKLKAYEISVVKEKHNELVKHSLLTKSSYEGLVKEKNKVNSRSCAQKKDAQFHKTTKRYMPIEKKSGYKKHDRQIPIGQKFSPNKSSTVYLKTTPPRSGLTWKPTGRTFTYVGLRWIPIRNSVETCYTTNDSASPLGKETLNPNTTICANSSFLNAVTMKILPESTSNSSEVGDLQDSI